MTCIKALNNAAMLEPNPDKRSMLKGAALLLREAVEALAINPTVENMIDLNGAWAYAARVLATVSPNEPTAPLGSAADQRRAA